MSADHFHHESAFSLVGSLLNVDFTSFYGSVPFSGLEQTALEDRK